jgi:hypothetical protein
VTGRGKWLQCMLVTDEITRTATLASLLRRENSIWTAILSASIKTRTMDSFNTWSALMELLERRLLPSQRSVLEAKSNNCHLTRICFFATPLPATSIHCRLSCRICSDPFAKFGIGQYNGHFGQYRCFLANKSHLTNAPGVSPKLKI